MYEGCVEIFCGNGRGKTSMALGKSIRSCSRGNSVVIIQFLRGKGLTEDDYARRLEPEIKLFRFEKSNENFSELSKEKQEEEVKNIKNGLNFAKKVLNTGECDMLILDEVLGLLDNGILNVEDLRGVLSLKGEETDIILTGIPVDERACCLADYVTEIRTIK